MASQINKALMGLSRRAERNEPEKLVTTFVDVGSLFSLLSSHDHQVLYGRRGTGKTHALHYLGGSARRNSDIALYVDMRTIGSTGGIYGDTNLPLTERGTRLLSDTLANLHDTLVDEVLAASYHSDHDFGIAMEQLERLGDSLQDVQVVGSDEEQETTAEVGGAVRSRADVGLTVGTSPTFGIRTRDEASARQRVRIRRVSRGPLRHRVHFGAVSNAIDRVVESLPGRVWILLDEWSDVPLDLQPLLADLLRRCLMPVRKVTVKIGAIEQRSNFREPDGVGGYVGLELGADITADVDLDDFMVFGNDSEKAKAFSSSCSTSMSYPSPMTRQIVASRRQTNWFGKGSPSGQPSMSL